MNDVRPDDLVLRLRKAYTSLKLCQGLSVGYDTFNEAADEIERLRKEASQAHSRGYTRALLDSGEALP